MFCVLTHLGLQFRFGDKLLIIRVACPHKGTAVLTRVEKNDTVGMAPYYLMSSSNYEEVASTSHPKHDFAEVFLLLSFAPPDQKKAFVCATSSSPITKKCY